jgi:hypothetical protein
MNVGPDDLRTPIVKLHKGWADRYTLLWQFIVLLLFGGIYFLLEQSGMDAAERAGAFVFLAVMVLVATVWQAVGLGVARIHMLLNGIDLEQLPKRNVASGQDRAPTA